MRLFDYDPFTGITEYVDYDHQTDTLIVHRVQDVEPVLEQNKAIANEVDISKRGIKDGWWRFAHIPAIVIEQWLKEGINIFSKNDKKKVFEKLNDPDYRYLKTTTGRHAGR